MPISILLPCRGVTIHAIFNSQCNAIQCDSRFLRLMTAAWRRACTFASSAWYGLYKMLQTLHSVKLASMVKLNVVCTVAFLLFFCAFGFFFFGLSRSRPKSGCRFRTLSLLSFSPPSSGSESPRPSSQASAVPSMFLSSSVGFHDSRPGPALVALCPSLRFGASTGGEDAGDDNGWSISEDSSFGVAVRELELGATGLK